MIAEMAQKRLPKNPWVLRSVYRNPAGELWNKWIPQLQCGAIIRPDHRVYRGNDDMYYVEFYKTGGSSRYDQFYSVQDCKDWAEQQFSKEV